MPVVLALDAGTGSAKCIAIDHAGAIRGFATQPWEYDIAANPDVPMVKEYGFDPDHFWSILAECARRAVSGIDAAEIVAVVTTSQREGCVFLGADGRELYAGPNLDSRGFLEGLEILEKLGPERLYEITGHSAPFIFPLARYLYFRKHDKRPVARLLMINDWMIYRACGAQVAEPSNACESMLFDVRERSWSDEIVNCFDIDSRILPEIGTPGGAAGEVSRQAAAELGVATGTPVYIGGADTQCGLVGAGATAPGELAAMLGTTSPVQVITERVVLDPACNLWAGCHVVNDLWVLEANVGSTGDAYQWMIDLLVPAGADRYARAEAMATAAATTAVVSFTGPRIFDLTMIRPDLPGALLFPFPSLQMRPDAGQLLRSVLESIAFAVRANVEQLEQVGGRAFDRLRVGGGMSRNAFLVGAIADVTGMRVERPSNADSTALGAAMLAFVGAGVHADIAQAVAAMCRCDTVEPAADAEAVAARYAKWRSLYDSLDQLSL